MSTANRGTSLRYLLSALAGLLIAGTATAQTTSQPASVPVVPPPEPANTLYLDLSTGGRVSIQLRPDMAPNSVERIKTLARRHFYDGIIFHRVIDGFMAQTGDPTGTGAGGSDLPDLKAEFNILPHVRGAVAMARAESPDSANSQFFIVLQPVLRLDGKYTVVGRVTGGMNYVDAIEKGEPPANPSRIIKAYMGDNPQGDAVPAAGADASTPAPPPTSAPPKLEVEPTVGQQVEPATGATPADPSGDE